MSKIKPVNRSYLKKVPVHIYTPNPTNTEAELDKMIDDAFTYYLGNRKDAIIDTNPLKEYLKPLILAHTAKAVEETNKGGFYAGQAMAGVELEQCHQNWKRWNTSDEVKAQLKESFSHKIVESNKEIRQDFNNLKSQEEE